MKITNRFGLPDAFINFARDDKYSKGDADISVTTLIDSPRIRLLKEQRSGELESDISDMIWPLFGTAVHQVLESTTDTEKVAKEERLYADVAGWVLSGAIDHQEVLDDGTVQITDYKVTSVWSVILGKDEWNTQLNTYAWMVENSKDGVNKGRRVSKIRVCAVLRDWQRKKAEFDSDYPQAPIHVMELDLWPSEAREDYVYQRVTDHQNAQIAFDTEDKLVPCLPKEQWAKPDTYRVMKRGQKRAVRVFETEAEAKNYINSSDLLGDANLYIEKRDGELTRCAGNYCNVAEFCEQWKGWK